MIVSILSLKTCKKREKNQSQWKSNIQDIGLQCPQFLKCPNKTPLREEKLECSPLKTTFSKEFSRREKVEKVNDIYLREYDFISYLSKEK
jgi:hypothetical protein